MTEATKPQLNIEAEIAKIKAMYEEGTNHERTSFLVYGDSGSGKTRSIITAPGPILVDSFDPGGTDTIRKAINDGKVVADTRWEKENPAAPDVFLKWQAEYKRRRQTKFFDHFKTYVIDSATTWSGTIMNQELKRQGRSGGPPQQNDYLPVMQVMENLIKDMTSNLPCNLILICHEDSDKDELTGRIKIGPLFIGKLKMRIPLLFSEFYATQTKETSKGVEYTFLTRNSGLYKARTRIGAEGLFDTYEKPDYTYLLEKAGYKVS